MKQYSEQKARNLGKEQAFAQADGPTEEGMKINGLQQVVDLLRFADPAFRESSLRKIIR
jgi:hypothetical protein